MTRLTAFVLGLGVLASSSALAAERTVTLAVQNMFCADCPFIVKKNLEAAGCR
jgi:mercuric ion binding protein